MAKSAEVKLRSALKNVEIARKRAEAAQAAYQQESQQVNMAPAKPTTRSDSRADGQIAVQTAPPPGLQATSKHMDRPHIALNHDSQAIISPGHAAQSLRVTLRADISRTLPGDVLPHGNPEKREEMISAVTDCALKALHEQLRRSFMDNRHTSLEEFASNCEQAQPNQLFPQAAIPNAIRGNQIVANQPLSKRKRPHPRPHHPKATNVPRIQPAAKERPSPTPSDDSVVEIEPPPKKQRADDRQQPQELQQLPAAPPMHPSHFLTPAIEAKIEKMATSGDPPYNFNAGRFEDLPLKYQRIYHKERGTSSQQAPTRPDPSTVSTAQSIGDQHEQVEDANRRQSAGRLSIMNEREEGGPPVSPQGVPNYHSSHASNNQSTAGQKQVQKVDGPPDPASELQRYNSLLGELNELKRRVEQNRPK